MKIVSILKGAGVEKSSAYIEVIKLLVRKGIDVDIVIANQNRNYIEESYYLNNANINLQILNIIDCNNGKVEILKKIIRKLKLEKICTTLLLAYQRICFGINRKKYEDDKSYAYDIFLDPSMRGYKLNENYDYILVNDEYGLLWADWINEKSDKKYKIIYYCLELYWEHYSLPMEKKWQNFSEYLLFEEARKALLKASLIVIQDEARWEVLCKYTGLGKDVCKVFLPVSMQSYKNVNTDVLSEKINIEKGKKVIFYPTFISAKRGCIELIHMTRFLNNEYLTVIHGFTATQGFLREVEKNIDDTERVIVSNTTFDYQELVDMHQDVWCVFLYYGESDNNNRYIVNASNKLVMSLQAGKPIITIGNHMLADLCKETGCGVSMNSWSGEEFVRAVSELDRNYEQYCWNARKCFEERYNINIYGEVLYDALIQNLSGGSYD